MNLADSALSPSPCPSSPHLPVLTWPGSLLSTPLSTGVRILGFLVGPCPCPLRSTLRFRLVQTWRGGAWGGPSPRSCRIPSGQTSQQGAAWACLSGCWRCIFTSGQIPRQAAGHAYLAVPSPQGLCAQQGGDLSPQPRPPERLLFSLKWGFSKHLWIVQKGGSIT